MSSPSPAGRWIAAPHRRGGVCPRARNPARPGPLRGGPARRRRGPVADLAELLSPASTSRRGACAEEAVAARGWAGDVHVGNDTFAVLRAGTERGWGVAVVCGPGSTASASTPHGRHCALSRPRCDLGRLGRRVRRRPRGSWRGRAQARTGAARTRASSGRSLRTSASTRPASWRGDPSGTDLRSARARAAADRLRRGSGRPGRGEIVDRVGAEIAALARPALRRLELDRQPVEVLLGGGLLRAGDGRVLAGVEASYGPRLPKRPCGRRPPPPIVGAALLALDRLGAGVEAQRRVRRELGRRSSGPKPRVR
jgi:hypothetical protein